MKIIKESFFLIILVCVFGNGKAQNTLSTIKNYSEVITHKAISEEGFISTHLLNGKVYLEIPEEILENELLFINHNNSSFDKENIFIFKKRHQTIQLILQEIESKAGNTIQLLRNRYDIEITPVSFPILAIGNQRISYVIDATDLFLNTPKGLQGGGKSIVENSSFIDQVRAFPSTVEVQTTTTVSTEDGPVTSIVNLSIMLLPEPMMPRLYDQRMGFYDESRSINNFNVLMRASIAKWRLIKKHPALTISEPIAPIVFYLDPKIPEKWKSYVKAGVYEWLPAFETAGFKNALIVKDAPSDDEIWSLNSMRYSVIRWENRSEFRGHEGKGFGTVKNYVDQRTGEILKADILIGMIDMLVDVYFARCSPLDKRALHYPFPDDLMGELIQSLTAHEAGHAFGIKDANFGEYSYPFEKMRDEKWLRKMGHSPSVMNYARQNFIVQPEDNLNPSLLHQKVGPTDHYNIRWAYSQFPNISSPEDELPFLEKIVREQDVIPWFKYNLEYQSLGPESVNEVVDNNNPIKTAELGVLNLKRVMDLIPKISLNESNDMVKKRFYISAINLWVDQMRYVESLIGGYKIHYKLGTQTGGVYIPITYDRQKEAMKFLLKEALHPPLWMVRPDITERFIVYEQYSLDGKMGFMNNTLEIISGKQRKILKDLFSPIRLRALEDNGVTNNNNYSIAEMFQDLSKGLWKELDEKSIKINFYRQELQFSYIVYLKEALIRESQKLNKEYTYNAFGKYRFSNYSRGIIASELANLKTLIERVLRKVKDESTLAHLNLCLKEISVAHL